MPRTNSHTNSFATLWCCVFIAFLLAGCGGSDDKATVLVPVLPSITLTASEASVQTDSEFTLSWSVLNADTCSASNDWSGDRAIAGSEQRVESLIGNKTYTLSCYGAGGGIAKSITVDITPLSNDENNGIWDYTEIAYGTDDPSRQWLNIHLAYDQAKPTPIYLFAHANGGTAYSMSEKQLDTIAGQGYTTISWESIATINTNEDASIAFEDADIMYEWVLTNAAMYNLDPDHIVIGGRSRGSIVSWRLAHSGHQSIKGIYMYNALPKGIWDNTENWSPVDEVTTNSPQTFLVYGPDFDDEDGHNPIFVEPVVDRYNELLIGDRMTRYVDMWGDFTDEQGRWNNDAEIMHYFPEFVDAIQKTNNAGYNAVFMGHSFYAPIARQIPFHAEQLELDSHRQHVEFSGGASGMPIALWEDEEHRHNIQTYLNSGTVELFGMTYGIVEGYMIWIDYALSQNPETKFLIGLPWLDYPADYNDAEDYANQAEVVIYDNWKRQLEILRESYPGVEIISMPYGFAAVELRKMYDAGELPGVTDLIGQNSRTSLFKDAKGHGHASGMILDLAEYIWLATIYDIDLNNYDYDAGHSINLKDVAQTILFEYEDYFE